MIWLILLKKFTKSRADTARRGARIGANNENAHRTRHWRAETYARFNFTDETRNKRQRIDTEQTFASSNYFFPFFFFSRFFFFLFYFDAPPVTHGSTFVLAARYPFTRSPPLPSLPPPRSSRFTRARGERRKSRKILSTSLRKNGKNGKGKRENHWHAYQSSSSLMKANRNEGITILSYTILI